MLSAKCLCRKHTRLQQYTALHLHHRGMLTVICHLRMQRNYTTTFCFCRYPVTHAFRFNDLKVNFGAIKATKTISSGISVSLTLQCFCQYFKSQQNSK